MDPEALSIGELADAAGLTRRAIRYYVQQKLLPPPTGRGRGRHYDARHVDQLRRVLDLQAAGHSLEAIRTILASPDGGGGGGTRATAGTASQNGASADGASADGATRHREPSGAAAGAPPEPAVLRAELWTRLRIGDGIELSYDATKHNPTVEQLLELRQRIRQTLI